MELGTTGGDSRYEHESVSSSVIVFSEDTRAFDPSRAGVKRQRRGKRQLHALQFHATESRTSELRKQIARVHVERSREFQDHSEVEIIGAGAPVPRSGVSVSSRHEEAGTSSSRRARAG